MLTKRFKDEVTKWNCFDYSNRLLLAVSGGRDSMVLANLLIETGYNFSVAHVNFGLRGEESDGDEILVKQWCESMGINCHIKTIDLKTNRESHQSIQMAAREVRYNWFADIMHQFGYDRLITAHHANDQLETVLYNLTRGTGIQGAAGMRHLKGNHARPLLSISQMEIVTYAMEKNISWREDSSNEDDKYARNLIRLSVIPQLEKINPSLSENFNLTLERLADARDVVQGQVDSIRSVHMKSYLDGFKLDLAWLEKTAGGRTILYEIIKVYGFHYHLVRQLLTMQDGLSGKKIISPSHEATLDRGHLLILPVKVQDFNQVTIDLENDSYTLPHGDLTLRLIPRKELKLYPVAEHAYLDADLIKFPLYLRKWQQGDRFVPFGMKNNQKISDFLINQKVSVPEKELTMVLVSGDEICWLVGHRINEHYKVTATTNQVLMFSWKTRG